MRHVILSVRIMALCISQCSGRLLTVMETFFVALARRNSLYPRLQSTEIRRQKMVRRCLGVPHWQLLPTGTPVDFPFSAGFLQEPSVVTLDSGHVLVEDTRRYHDLAASYLLHILRVLSVERRESGVCIVANTCCRTSDTQSKQASHSQ